MLDCQVLEGTNVVEISHEGKITRSDILTASTVIDQALKDHSKIRLLQIGHSFSGWELSALWEELKHMKLVFKISHMALVTDVGWMRRWASVFGSISPMQVKSFKMDELDAAKNWLSTV